MAMGEMAGALATASIAVSISAYYIAAAWFDHRERLAKIERGIDPDSPSKKEV